MHKLLRAVLLVASLSGGPALAQSDADTDAAVDAVLGGHAAYRAAFDSLQGAIANDDADAFAEWVSYPIAVKADGEELTVEDPEQFVAHFDDILTDEIRTAISGQEWSNVLVNAQGVMLGDGQVWLNGVCRDEACAEFDVRVVTIQSAN